MKVMCCNCGGEHNAAFGGCQVQREAREAQRYRISHDALYAEAVKQKLGIYLVLNCIFMVIKNWPDHA